MLTFAIVAMLCGFWLADAAIELPAAALPRTRERQSPPHPLALLVAERLHTLADCIWEL